MKSTHLLIATSLLALFSCTGSSHLELSSEAVAIPIGGNTYVTSAPGGAEVTEEGIQAWEDTTAVLSSWFRVSQPGELRLFVKAGIREGSAALRLTVAGQTFRVEVNSPDPKLLPVGSITLTDPGYVRVDIQREANQGSSFPEIDSLLIDGPAAAEPLNFVRDFEAYWGRRGPSVHMKYWLPEEPVEYFYNEVTVPEGEDQIGSYFMTNGFGEGYCGMQVNSESERRFLFSVWSPFVTDNPQDIPEEKRVRLLSQGEGVHIGEFGDEGSGGQSYLIYPWKAGETYRFITRVRPDGKGNTTYTAWFLTPEADTWKQIASFLRPETNTWYTGAHSFLENFIPEQGYLGRSVRFGNQWARTAKGEWQELTEGTFTYDATAKAQVRTDYAGGIDGNCFYLKNGGFFNANTALGTSFSRPAQGTAPDDKALQEVYK